jgi:hypothetical protein
LNLVRDDRNGVVIVENDRPGRFLKRLLSLVVADEHLGVFPLNVYKAWLLAVLGTLRWRRFTEILELLGPRLELLLKSALLRSRLLVALLGLAESGIACTTLLGELKLEPVHELSLVGLGPALLLETVLQRGRDLHLQLLYSAREFLALP